MPHRCLPTLSASVSADGAVELAIVEACDCQPPRGAPAASCREGPSVGGDLRIPPPLAVPRSARGVER